MQMKESALNKKGLRVNPWGTAKTQDGNKEILIEMKKNFNKTRKKKTLISKTNCFVCDHIDQVNLWLSKVIHMFKLKKRIIQ